MYEYKIITNTKIKKLPKYNVQNKRQKVQFKDEIICYEYSYKKKIFNLKSKIIYFMHRPFLSVI